MGETADKLYSAAITTYALVWRTLGEVTAIAVASLIAGLAGGAAGTRFPGVLGAAAIGLAVGLTNKHFYLVLIGAPGGALVGLIFGAVLWVLFSPKALVFCVSGLAILGAVIGGRRRPRYRSRNWWEKLRPFLGALGGLFFGLLGVLVGWGLQTTLERLF
jgi:hypothetical protein